MARLEDEAFVCDDGNTGRGFNISITVMKRSIFTFGIFTLSVVEGLLSVFGFSHALVPSASALFGVNSAEGQTTHNLEIIWQRGIPDTSLRYWGAAIAGVGDVNGDGYDDVAVGCFRIYSDQDTAKVFVYYGSAVMDTVHDVLISDWSGGHDGLSICGSDINGDGYSDLIVCRDKVYIHYGSPTGPSVTPNIVFGGRLYESFTSVATGDLNGDDTTDLIVGDFWNMNGNGHVNIYLGSAAFDTIPWLVIRGHGGEESGSDVKSGGDVNNDGYEDLAVGAFNYDGERGRVYLFHGGNTMDTVPDWWKDGSPGDQWFGANGRLADICIDSMGFDRIWAGEPWFPTGYPMSPGPLNGLVWLFYGGTTMDSLPDITIIGSSESSEIPLAACVSIYDSLSGYSNLFAGSNDGADTAYGKGYYWLGRNPLDTIVDGWVEGRNKYDRFTSRGNSAGDVNNDGREEVIFANNNGSDRLVVICKYTGPNGIDMPIANGELLMAKLHQNAPNPFKHITTIKYQITKPGKVSIKTYNIAGQLVKKLVNEDKKTGSYKVTWDGRDEKGILVSNGVYLCRLQAGDDAETMKMTIIR